MDVNNSGDEYTSPKNCDGVNSPRKRMRLENSANKSWRLMDRRTDHEVLQEMGVSLLEQDDNEGIMESMHHRPSLKRKHNIENVSPNVLINSPRKISKRSPIPGPSKGRSPKSIEKAKPSPESKLDQTLITDYLIEEETPLGQSVSAEYHPGITVKRQNTTPLGQQEDLIFTSLRQWQPSGEDSFSKLSDEVMLTVFRWLPKRTLAHCMQVCKRWYRVACDETLWQRLDLGNKTLAKDALGRILSRKPIIVRLASSEISEWHPTTVEPSRIQYLDLSMCTIDAKTLDCLLASSQNLSKLSVENIALTEHTCSVIGKCRNLETLNLTMAQGITKEGLNYILEGCVNLLSLNISWTNLTEETLTNAAKLLPKRLQRLNLSGARSATDEIIESVCGRCRHMLELDLSDCSRLSVASVGHVMSLYRLEYLSLSRCYCVQLIESVCGRCRHMLELDLSDCSRLSVASVAHVMSLYRLEHLSLSRCYLLPAQALAKLNAMSSLQYLEVWGMLQSQSIATLRAALPAVQINQFMFSAIARPTVGTRRTSIWGLRTRD